MELLGAVFLRVLTLSAGCSAVLAPLLLLAPRIRKRVAARSFYILFLLLALRLAVPVELSLPRRQAVVTVPAPSYTVSVPAAPAPAAVQAQVAAPAPAQTETAPRPVPSVPDPVPTPAAREIPVAQLLALVWAAGIGVCALWAAGSYLLARRRLCWPAGWWPARARRTPRTWTPQRWSTPCSTL